MAAWVFGFDAAHSRGDDGLADLTYSRAATGDFGVRVRGEVATAVSPPSARSVGVKSRPGTFGMCPFLFVIFPGFPQCGDCLIPLAHGTVLVVGGVDCRLVVGGEGHPVRCLMCGGGRRRVGDAALGDSARGVVLSRAVDAHGPPSLRGESRRLPRRACSTVRPDRLLARQSVEDSPTLVGVKELSAAELGALVAEATVDAYTDDEELTGSPSRSETTWQCRSKRRSRAPDG